MIFIKLHISPSILVLNLQINLLERSVVRVKNSYTGQQATALAPVIKLNESTLP